MTINTVLLLLLCHFAFAEDERDPANRNFLQCGRDKNLPCLQDCRYRNTMPGPGRNILLGELDDECLHSKHFEDYVHCATGPTDNRDCCRKAGVRNPMCLELCDGTNPLSDKDPVAFYDCAGVRKLIAQCGHDANNHD